VLRVEPYPAHEQRRRARRTDASDDVGRDDRRDDANADLGEADDRVRRRDGDVRNRDEPGPAAERGSLHADDERHREVVQCREHLGERA